MSRCSPWLCRSGSVVSLADPIALLGFVDNPALAPLPRRPELAWRKLLLRSLLSNARVSSLASTAECACLRRHRGRGIAGLHRPKIN